MNGENKQKVFIEVGSEFRPKFRNTPTSNVYVKVTEQPMEMGCRGCFFSSDELHLADYCSHYACNKLTRKDKKSVIFKRVR